MLVPALAGLAGWMMSNPRRKRRRNPTLEAVETVQCAKCGRPEANALEIARVEQGGTPSKRLCYAAQYGKCLLSRFAYKRHNPGLVAKRAANFKDFGFYDVTLADGTVIQISRDGGSGGNGWWYVEWPRLHHVDRFIGFTKSDALQYLEGKVAYLRQVHPHPEAPKPAGQNPKRRRKRK